jgi:hypothetical protein
MLARLGKTMRWKAALTLAVLYALSFLVPPVAFAVSGGPAHCLTDTGSAHVHESIAKPVQSHAHGDGASHSHGAHDHADDGIAHDHADGSGKSATNCCGLFCVSAMAHASPEFATSPVVSTQMVAVLADVLTDRGPDRMNRPPIR